MHALPQFPLKSSVDRRLPAPLIYLSIAYAALLLLPLALDFSHSKRK